jgi:hypothetical protein
MWNWWVFAAATIVCTCFVMFTRGAMNRSNIERFGTKADYRVGFKPNRVHCFLDRWSLEQCGLR